MINRSSDGTNPIVDRIPDHVLAEVWFSVRQIAFERLVAIFRAKKASDPEFAQTDLANRIGMDPGQLSKILSGRKNVTLRTLSNIAYAMDRRLDVTFIDLSSISPHNEHFEALHESWHDKNLRPPEFSSSKVARYSSVTSVLESEDFTQSERK